MSHVPAYAYPYFHRLTAEEVMARVNKRWDLSGVLPFPKWRMLCPVCRSADQLLRHWKFHAYRTDSDKTIGPRCDVAFKCRDCSLTYLFGVATTPEMNAYWGFHTEVTYREAMSGFEPPKGNVEEWGSYRGVLDF